VVANGETAGPASGEPALPIPVPQGPGHGTCGLPGQPPQRERGPVGVLHLDLEPGGAEQALQGPGVDHAAHLELAVALTGCQGLGPDMDHHGGRGFGSQDPLPRPSVHRATRASARRAGTGASSSPGRTGTLPTRASIAAITAATDAAGSSARRPRVSPSAHHHSRYRRAWAASASSGAGRDSTSARWRIAAVETRSAHPINRASVPAVANRASSTTLFRDSRPEDRASEVKGRVSRARAAPTHRSAFHQLICRCIWTQWAMSRAPCSRQISWRSACANSVSRSRSELAITRQTSSIAVRRSRSCCIATATLAKCREVVSERGHTTGNFLDIVPGLDPMPVGSPRSMR
jgi:hypothetical protein